MWKIYGHKKRLDKKLEGESVRFRGIGKHHNSKHFCHFCYKNNFRLKYSIFVTKHFAGVTNNMLFNILLKCSSLLLNSWILELLTFFERYIHAAFCSDWKILCGDWSNVWRKKGKQYYWLYTKRPKNEQNPKAYQIKIYKYLNAIKTTLETINKLTHHWQRQTMTRYFRQENERTSSQIDIIHCRTCLLYLLLLEWSLNEKNNKWNERHFQNDSCLWDQYKTRTMITDLDGQTRGMLQPKKLIRIFL